MLQRWWCEQMFMQGSPAALCPVMEGTVHPSTPTAVEQQKETLAPVYVRCYCLSVMTLTYELVLQRLLWSFENKTFNSKEVSKTYPLFVFLSDQSVPGALRFLISVFVQGGLNAEVPALNLVDIQNILFFFFDEWETSLSTNHYRLFQRVYSAALFPFWTAI